VLVNHQYLSDLGVWIGTNQSLPAFLCIDRPIPERWYCAASDGVKHGVQQRHGFNLDQRFLSKEACQKSKFYLTL